jgi:hypothetical protein
MTSYKSTTRSKLAEKLDIAMDRQAALKPYIYIACHQNMYLKTCMSLQI